MLRFITRSLFVAGLVTGLACNQSKVPDLAAEGKVAYDAGNNDLAVAKYSEAIQVEPTKGINYAGRGLAYLVKKDYDRARADYQEAIRLDINTLKERVKLSPAELRVLELRQQGWKIREIAAQRGVKDGTVKREIFRIKTKLANARKR